MGGCRRTRPRNTAQACTAPGARRLRIFCWQWVRMRGPRRPSLRLRRTSIGARQGELRRYRQHSRHVGLTRTGLCQGARRRGLAAPTRARRARGNAIYADCPVASDHLCDGRLASCLCAGSYREALTPSEHIFGEQQTKNCSPHPSTFRKKCSVSSGKCSPRASTHVYTYR